MATTLPYTGPGPTTQFVIARADPLGNKAPLHSADFKASLIQTPTVTAGSAYAAGNVVGGRLTFGSAVRGSEFLSGIIRAVIITDKANQQGQYDLWFFDSNPSSTTVTDKTNLTINSGDITKSLGFVTVAAWCEATSGGAVGQALLDNPIVLTGSSLYAILIARGTPTFANASDISVRLIVAQD